MVFTQYISDIMKRFLTILFAAAALTAAAARVPLCDNCGKPCKRMVMTFGDKNYCSKNCFQVANVCFGCGRPIQKSGTFKVSLMGETMLFCPECAERPSCFVCCYQDNLSILPDGRFICSVCLEEAVTDPEEAAELLDFVRRMLLEYFGLPYDHEIPVVFTDLREGGLDSETGAMRLAAHNFNYSIRTTVDADGKITASVPETHCTISVLTYSPRELLLDSMAHEMAHDFLRHKCGFIDDLRLEEGFAETVAACCDEIRGNAAMNIRREKNTDPIYGDGYRMMRTYVTENGWVQAVELMRANSKSMEEKIRETPIEQLLNPKALQDLRRRGVTPHF